MKKISKEINFKDDKKSNRLVTVGGGMSFSNKLKILNNFSRPRRVD